MWNYVKPARSEIVSELYRFETRPVPFIILLITTPSQHHVPALSACHKADFVSASNSWRSLPKTSSGNSQPDHFVMFGAGSIFVVDWNSGPFQENGFLYNAHFKWTMMMRGKWDLITHLSFWPSWCTILPCSHNVSPSTSPPLTTHPVLFQELILPPKRRAPPNEHT